MLFEEAARKELSIKIVEEDRRPTCQDLISLTLHVMAVLLASQILSSASVPYYLIRAEPF